MTVLTLASASPRRFALLQQIGVACEVLPAAIDEAVRPGELPDDYVQRMAREKALAVAPLVPGPVLAADTSVVIDDDILGKPQDLLHGLAMLARLSGRTHAVKTAVCLAREGVCDVVEVTTRVTFVSLDRALCEAYLATGEPWDKAGAYGIQGMGAVMVSSIEGSYSNVVGLPLAETWRLLTAAKVKTGLNPSGERL